jgi:hypothetical protein
MHLPVEKSLRRAERVAHPGAEWLDASLGHDVPAGASLGCQLLIVRVMNSSGDTRRDVLIEVLNDSRRHSLRVPLTMHFETDAYR